jgi:hypothetical protein
MTYSALKIHELECQLQWTPKVKGAMKKKGFFFMGVTSLIAIGRLASVIRTAPAGLQSCLRLCTCTERHKRTGTDALRQYTSSDTDTAFYE